MTDASSFEFRKLQLFEGNDHQVLDNIRRKEKNFDIVTVGAN